MFTILIITIITVFIGLYKKYDRDKKQKVRCPDALPDDNWIEVIMLFTIIGLIIGALITMLLTGIIMYNRKSETYSRYLLIENLQDNNQTQGSFVLGSGTINGVWKYTFYYRTQSGNIRLGQIDANSVDIRYTDSQPTIQYTFKRTMRVGNEKYFLLSCPEEETLINTTILVKKGTIKQNYNLDAQ